MATSKNDKTPKIMDVARPGRTAPPATARPVIVTNRPMIKQDPMVAPSTPAGETPAEEKPVVSRTAKSIKIMPIHADLDEPQTEAAAEAATPTAPASDTPMAAPAAAERPNEQEIAMEVGQEMLASLDQPEEPAEQPAEIAPAMPFDLTSDDKTDAAPVDTAAEPEMAAKTTEPDKADAPNEAAETITVKKEASSLASKAAAPLKPTGPATLVTDPVKPKLEPLKPDVAPPKPASAEATKPEPTPATPVSEAETPPPATPVNDSVGDDADETDDQLAPNQAVDEAKRKQEEEAAARQAEQEKIIDSKQYYLPIASHEKRRGTQRSILVLVLVVLLSLVWLDVVLDAGILRIPGVHALTHFFGNQLM